MSSAMMGSPKTTRSRSVSAVAAVAHISRLHVEAGPSRGVYAEVDVRTVVRGRHEHRLGLPARDPSVVRAVQLFELLLRRSADVQLDVEADPLARDVVLVVTKSFAGAAALKVCGNVDDVPRVAISPEGLSGLRRAILSADAPSDDALPSGHVHGVGVATAAADAGVEGVEGARRVDVAAGHLQLDLAQRGRVSPVGALQHDGAQAQIVASKRWAFAGVQRGRDATAHSRGHAGGSFVNEWSGHLVSEDGGCMRE